MFELILASFETLLSIVDGVLPGGELGIDPLALRCTIVPFEGLLGDVTSDGRVTVILLSIIPAVDV